MYNAPFQKSCPDKDPKQNFSSNQTPLQNPNSNNIFTSSSGSPQTSASTSKNELNVFFVTWNVCSLDTSVSEKNDYNSILFPPEYKNLLANNSPDLYVISLQEIVKLNTNNVLMNNTTNTPQLNYWLRKFAELLYKEYTLVSTATLVGICTIIFIKKSILNEVKHVKTVELKFGFFGALGNKGTCITTFRYKDKLLAFSSCHLTSGNGKHIERVKELKAILRARIDESGENLRFAEYDFWFIFGDLNIRNDVLPETAKEYIDNHCLEMLKRYDQFIQSKEEISPYITEGEIKFSPTYKYFSGTSNYNTKRVPSWCDRILYKKDVRIRQIFYDKVEISFSDHKPVIALLAINSNLY